MSCGLPTDGSRKFQPVVVASVNRDLGVADATQLVPITIDLWHQMRQPYDLATNDSRGSLNAARIGHAGQRRKLDVVDGDQRPIAEARVVARGGGVAVAAHWCQARRSARRTLA